MATGLLSHCRRVAVSTCQHKVKHHIAVPLRVPRLVVPPLALMLIRRKLMCYVADGNADVCTSAVMTDDDHDDNANNK